MRAQEIFAHQNSEWIAFCIAELTQDRQCTANENNIDTHTGLPITLISRISPKYNQKCNTANQHTHTIRVV